MLHLDSIFADGAAYGTGRKKLPTPVAL